MGIVLVSAAAFLLLLTDTTSTSKWTTKTSSRSSPALVLAFLHPPPLIPQGNRKSSTTGSSSSSLSLSPRRFRDKQRHRQQQQLTFGRRSTSTASSTDPLLVVVVLQASAAAAEPSLDHDHEEDAGEEATAKDKAEKKEVLKQDEAAVGNLVSESVQPAVLFDLKKSKTNDRHEVLMGKQEDEYLYKVGYSTSSTSSSKEIDSRVKQGVARLRGKEEYELGDFVRYTDELSKDITQEMTDATAARKILVTRPTGVRSGGSQDKFSDQEMVQKANIQGVIFPWMDAYKIWWYVTAAGAFFTCFLSPFMVGFENEPGFLFNDNDMATTVDAILRTIFAADILVQFKLAFHNKDGVLVFDKKQIFRNYFRQMFWVDLIGVFPFDTAALAISGLMVGQDGIIPTTEEGGLLYSLLSLFSLVRLHRIKTLSDKLQYNTRISLGTYTIWRNLFVLFAVTNFSGCIMYFIARVHGFGEDTWIGPIVDGLSGFDRYATSLYWSVVTFATVGYGDFSAVNSGEMIWGIIIMSFNMVIQAWFIGSTTLLVVKGDEKTGQYRDALATLEHYSDMHKFDDSFRTKLKTQLRLEFKNREIADEQVLKNFPNAVRRKVLSRLYLPFLSKTHLMKDVRQQFMDAFLSSCTVEIFSPGEEMVERGSIMSDLFLLVGGIAVITTRPSSKEAPQSGTDPADEGPSSYRSGVGSRSVEQGPQPMYQQLEAGDFIGEIGFLTDSPQVDSVSCVTVCKTLTLSKNAYTMIAQDHPDSVGKILQNLLRQVEQIKLSLPQPLSVPRAGSTFDLGPVFESSATNGALDDRAEIQRVNREIKRKNYELTAIKDLVKMHMSKQKDDQTTRFLFAASRGDLETILLMCDQGIDVNSVDYDGRTALMVASMKASDAVKTLLSYGADPNISDAHGTTALLEAVKNGHVETMELLLCHGAKLCMAESVSASVLCQAVFDGDILFLRRLLRAGIPVDAADYDKRTAAHIAAAEGNVSALKVLVEFGADLTHVDRWGNTIEHEAERSKAGKLVDYLLQHKESIRET